MKLKNRVHSGSEGRRREDEQWEGSALLPWLEETGL